MNIQEWREEGKEGFKREGFLGLWKGEKGGFSGNRDPPFRGGQCCIYICVFHMYVGRKGSVHVSEKKERKPN